MLQLEMSGTHFKQRKEQRISKKKYSAGKEIEEKWNANPSTEKYNKYNKKCNGWTD